jgi:large subunit ribosomal protein L15
MVVRRRKAKNKWRGNRTQHGNKANWRGAGSFGGKGRAGSHKHKYSKYYLTFGQKYRLKKKKGFGKAIDLDEIERKVGAWIEKKLVEQKGKVLEIDGKRLGIAKILGSGRIEKPISVKNCKVTGLAAEKILNAGGSILEAETEDSETEKGNSE